MTEQSLAESGALEVADVVLKLADLRAGYGSVPVLNGVNLEVHEGEAVGVVGHNGMGLAGQTEFALRLSKPG